MRRPRRDIDIFSLSFLDCICCGFGAIILLLTLTRMNEPKALEDAETELRGRIVRLERELFEIRGTSEVLQRELRGRKEQLSNEVIGVARLQGDLSHLRGQFKASQELSQVQDIIAGRMLAAQQELTEEMKRLQAQAERRPRTEGVVAGIPADSEYVVFVIDTSGSMQRYAWPALQRKMAQVLDAYPRMKGLQVMNDEGVYLFSTYAGKWIPDTPGRRSAVLERLSSWNAFSNSSPVEGIEAAIRTLASGSHKISIYVLGDEFTGSSIDYVLAEVDRLNRRGGREPRVRIHAIGFPTLIENPGNDGATVVRFSMLMRALCERNGGTFVGLNTASP
jgi:hypothetical protein